MEMAPQHMINVDVSRKPPIEEIAELMAAIRDAEAELADAGRVLVRYSGTQSMCRVMVEGPDKGTTVRLTEALAEKVQACIG
jgi:phosphoglucosamine mutase